MDARGSRLARRRALVAVACAGLLVLAGCDVGGLGDSAGASGDADPDDGRGFLGLGGGDDALRAGLVQPADEILVVPGSDATSLAAGTVDALVGTAPVVVLASPDEGLRAASAAVALGVPVVVDGPGTAEQLDRLGAEVALALGPVADPGIDVVVPASDEELADLLGVGSAAVTVPVDEAAQRLAEMDQANPELLVPGPDSDPAPVEPEGGASTTDGTTTDGATAEGSSTDGVTPTEDASSTTAPSPAHAPLTSDRDELPETGAPEPLASVTLLTDGDPSTLAALGTARAAGARVLVGPHTDPRADSSTVQALAQAGSGTVVGLGDGYGDVEGLTWKVATARTGVELPGGGQLVLPGKTYVALYGTPSTGSLGVLGEQPIEQTITRAEEHASWYSSLIDEPVVPTHEIIVTVASSGAGADGNYSNELPISEVEPLVDLAQEHGHYVVLDLQPGRTDFRTQAELYEDLLLRPNVGLALDPEWRIGPDEQHLVRIGHVEASEVNDVVDYLADLTREHQLPQKVLVLHMFQGRMIPDVEQVDQTRDEVAVLIHADGQGGQGDKQATWQALHQHAPSFTHWGWKNFYDEDAPMLSAEETMRLVVPTPDFISYQ